MARGRHIRRSQSRRRIGISTGALAAGLVAAALFAGTAFASHDGSSTVVDLTSLDATETFGDGVKVVQTSFD
ncbi:MAG: hypothetical protein WAL25_00885, partial [Acidimicrobiia bacterium]